MKKQLLGAALLLGCLMTTNAQTVVWSSDLEGSDFESWALLDVDDDGYQWEVVEDEGNHTFVSASFVDGFGPLEPDNWLIVSPLDLSGYASGDVLTFHWEARSTFSDPSADAENYTVYVATSNTVGDLSASSVSFNEVLSGVYTLSARSLDISSFAGESAVYIAFRHHNVTDQYAMEIDNLSVEAEATASIREHLSSQFSVFPNPVSDVMNVKNLKNALINKVEIIDMNGRVVKSVELEGTLSEVQVNVYGLESGIYILNVFSDEEITVKKIIKK